MKYNRTGDILHVMRILSHKSIRNTMIYIGLERVLFTNPKNEEFTARVAHNVEEACGLVEAGFDYVTGDYGNGVQIFRKRK